MKRKEKRVTCKICGKSFRNHHVYGGHVKVHNRKSIENIRKSKLGNQNPDKRLDVRIKISNALKGKKPWNKNKKWTKDKRHNQILKRSVEKIKDKDTRIFTTHGYVPDAIIVNFKKQTVKSFELNPQSIISKELRAKNKGYDALIIKVRRNKKYKHKNTDKEIQIMPTP